MGAVRGLEVAGECGAVLGEAGGAPAVEPEQELRVGQRVCCTAACWGGGGWGRWRGGLDRHGALDGDGDAPTQAIVVIQSSPICSRRVAGRATATG